MFYVYFIKSKNFPDKKYIGYTDNLKERIATHNSGGSIYTKDHRPWILYMAIAFEDKLKAAAFEKYLKTGAGRAFAKNNVGLADILLINAIPDNSKYDDPGINFEKVKDEFARLYLHLI